MADSPRTGPGQASEQNVPQRPSLGDKTTIVLVQLIRLLSTVVDKYGWPGAVLVASFVSVHLWASSAQKQQIVAKFVLGEGMGTWWPIAISTAFAVLVVWAQYETNKKTVRLLKREVARIGAEKSGLQELISGRPLQHSQVEDEDEKDN